MKSAFTTAGGLCLVAMLAAGCATQPPAASAKSPAYAAEVPAAAQADWSATIDDIEACSCPAFCQCYFAGEPALHESAQHAMRFCKFNNAYRISSGHYGDTKLDGMKIWMAGDLGGDFSKGQMDWMVVRYEPSATPQQRQAAEAIIRQIYPVKWGSFTTGPDARMDWQINDDTGVAKLNDGKSAEIVLKQNRDAAGKPVVIHNVQYWAAPSNTGIRVMKNEVEAYRDGSKPFEFKQTNGFFISFTISSNGAKSAQTMVPAKVQLLNAAQATSGDGACCEK